MKMTSSLRVIRHLSTTRMAPQATSSISAAKRKLQREYNPDKALQILSSVSEHGTSSVSSPYATELAVKRLAKARRFEEIKYFINSQFNSLRIKQEDYYSTLIRCYGKAGMFDCAVELYGRMEKCGTPRTSLSFNALLAAGNNCRLFSEVRKLFDEMPMIYGCSPDKYTYGILIKACCEEGDVKKAVNLLEAMEKKGIEVTNVCATTVLDALYRRGMTDEAEKIWSEMVEKGCVFDVAAWNVRIGHAHAIDGTPEEVETVIEEMRVAGLEPDMISYNYLLACYCRNDRLDEAMKLFEKLESGKLRNKAATFRIMIQYLCKKEEYGKGYDVFKKSVVRNKIPDSPTLEPLVKGMVKKGMSKDAKRLIRTVLTIFPPNACTGWKSWKKLEAELGLNFVVLDDETQEATS